MQLSGVCAQAGKIKALAIQGIVNRLSTRGEGFPLVLFNTDSQPFDDYVEAELEWFCQAPLKLLGPAAIAADASMDACLLPGNPLPENPYGCQGKAYHAGRQEEICFQGAGTGFWLCRIPYGEGGAVPLLQ